MRRKRLQTEFLKKAGVRLESAPVVPWDGEAGRVTNSEAANRYLRREYRKGWTL
jgi:hypothetical protein